MVESYMIAVPVWLVIPVLLLLVLGWVKLVKLLLMKLRKGVDHVRVVQSGRISLMSGEM